MAQRLMLAAVLMIGVFATAGSVMAADPGDAILGLWATDPEAEGGLSHVDIVKKNGTFSAEIVWLIDPNYGPDDEEGMAGQPKVDRNNPDKNDAGGA